jgi:N-dimethylarginine dimethylaminohydrolase
MEGNTNTVDPVLAAQQWTRVRDALRQAGADVIVAPEPPDNCPDAVFFANAGLIYDDIAVVSQFKHVERQVEEPYFIDYFNDKGFSTDCLPNYELPLPLQEIRPRISFEGAGDALFSSDRKRLFMGYGFRTDFEAKAALDWIFDTHGTIVIPLRLVDPRWYHLDTAFCPLDTGEALWYPGAFDEYSQSIVEAWYGDKLITVSEEDALMFACNAVSVGEYIVMPKQTDALYFELADRGYKVLTVDMSQFLRSGGACKCLTLEVVK